MKREWYRLKSGGFDIGTAPYSDLEALGKPLKHFEEKWQ